MVNATVEVSFGDASWLLPVSNVTSAGPGGRANATARPCQGADCQRQCCEAGDSCDPCGCWICARFICSPACRKRCWQRSPLIALIAAYPFLRGQSSASARGATALGYQSIASNSSTTAIGRAAKATGSQSSAFGVNAEASGNNGTIGNTLTATLADDTLTSGPRTLASLADYSITGGAVPTGLTLSIESDGSSTSIGGYGELHYNNYILLLKLYFDHVN